MPDHEASYNSNSKLESPRILSKYFRQIHQFGKSQIVKILGLLLDFYFILVELDVELEG